jgi:hypothetical protein
MDLGGSIRYWWVNQNKTWRQEVAGGYLWSPKNRSDGTKNPFYDWMTEISPGDLVFSFVNRQIIAIGVATSKAYTSPRPTEFGSSGSGWSEDGWRVDVDFTKAEYPIEPRQHMAVISPLLPEKYSPLQANGDGNQSYLHAISEDFAGLLLNLLGSPEIVQPTIDLDQIEFLEEEQEVISNKSLEETVKASLVMSRVGQGSFRNRVMFFEPDCRITGVAAKELLIASHIKPWKISSNEERLSGHNGLFLSPHVDKLFDRGFITFDDSGKVEVSPLLDRDVLTKWGLSKINSTRPFHDEQKYFLGFHREIIFKAA